MPRTTLNIDGPILRDLKRLQKREKKSLGRLVSDLLAWAIRSHEERQQEPGRFTWRTRAMGARVDLADKEAVWSVLDRPRNEESPGT